MTELKNPDNILEVIDKDDIYEKCLEKKKEGLRLSQICAAFIDDKLELSYSFMNDATYQFTTLRVVIDQDDEIYSVSEILPCAVFYENEMKELFGVKIKMINLDYNNKLYRINVETPFIPEDKREAARKAAAEAADKEASDDKKDETDSDKKEGK